MMMNMACRFAVEPAVSRRGLRGRCCVAALALLCFSAACPLAAESAGAAEVVDEPLGARYSLGMTLWHMGHQAQMIERFHEYLKTQGLTPRQLLSEAALTPPSHLVRILVEPELLGDEHLNGWQVQGEYITSGAGDAGPTTAIPLRVPRAGLYRLWIRYEAWTGSYGVTSIRIYRAGKEHLGPIHQPDELYDQAPENSGPAWKEMLVDLPAGDLVVTFGHVTRWWHGGGGFPEGRGGGGYARRHIDCMYLTDRWWAAPPDAEERQALRETHAAEGIQWTVLEPLAADQIPLWQWWQARPLSREDAMEHPRLFQTGRRFWDQVIDELSRRTYDEADKPDYRAPERQVVFHEIWNMIANPVRAKRQIDTLSADISREPLGYQYVWHDVGGNIDGLAPDGTFDPEGPYAQRGSWSSQPGELMAGYGNPRGTVTTRVPVASPGKYAMWVLSSSVNLHYTAPWFGEVRVEGKERFTYHHEGKIPTVWMKMGEVTLERPGEVQVDFVLDGAGRGGTYRRIHTLYLVDDLSITPQGTVRPPWSLEMYRGRAAQAGAQPEDTLLLWLDETPYRRLSQEVWADRTTAGDSWPDVPVSGTERTAELLMAGKSHRALTVGLRNLTDAPITLDVQPGPLAGPSGTFPDAVTWRVAAFVPDGTEAQTSASRQAWMPFFLMRRPNITVPPLNVAGAWLTVDTRDVPAGQYEAQVKFRGQDVSEHTVTLKVCVSAVKPAPQRPVLVDGYTQPHEGEADLRDFVEHGMNVWKGEMSKADMQRWGIRLLHLQYGSTDPEATARWIERLKALGLDYEDYFVSIKDEPSGTTEEQLKPFLDVARTIRTVDPKVRLCFNPSEAAGLATFQVLEPYADFWLPYSKHVFSPHFGNPQKKAIYAPKPWMWYTTPCLWDKTAREPGIRLVPSQPGNCLGVAFFALNYPWRDQWDTGYEHIRDASTMGAVRSRHGPVATIVWEEIREAAQTANLAMMVRERLGAAVFDDVADPRMQRLIRDGSREELILWLEDNPEPEDLPIMEPFESLAPDAPR